MCNFQKVTFKPKDNLNKYPTFFFAADADAMEDLESLLNPDSVILFPSHTG